jgi:hypothetical protein
LGRAGQARFDEADRAAASCQEKSTRSRMTAVALTDDQLGQVMDIAASILHDLRGDYLERIAADLRRRCDRDGSVGDGDVHRAALEARRAVMPHERVISGVS